MVDRQDDRLEIDALLIGALYGELTPADEARLAAHLESHPTDRGALDDLKVARQAVHESRIFAVQVEPPQALSAVLLQEAARRAPKLVRQPDTQERESWFFRLTRSFFAHPAMAAAAMLVLVLGVAGTLYLKKGGELAEQTISISSGKNTTDQAAPSAVTAPDIGGAGPTAAGSAAVAQGSGFKAELADDEGARRDGDGVAAGKADRAREGAPASATTSKDLRQRAEHEAVAKPPSKKPYLEVQAPEPAPKEMAKSKSKGASEKSAIAMSEEQQGALDGAAAGMAPGGGGGAATGAVNRAPAPAQAPRSAPSTYATPPPPPAADKVAADLKSDDAKKAEAKPVAPEKTATKEDGLLAWAKSQHATVQSLVRNNNCEGAGRAAAQLKDRAPDYFSAYVATDRSLKPCMQYISGGADAAEAERAAKAKKAAKPINSDETTKPARK